MAREKKPIFTQMEFDSAQYATAVKAQSEAKLAKVKRGLVIAAVAELAWILIKFFPETSSNLVDIIGVIILLLALAATVAAYIIGGGLGAAFGMTWSIAKALGWFGWICCPFPMDLVTGLLCSVLAMACIPIFFIFLPLPIVFFNYLQVKKDFQAAEEYLKYCTAINNAYDGGTAV